MKTLILPLIIVMLAVACGGSSDPEPTPTATAKPLPTLTGTMTLVDTFRGAAGDDCQGGGGFSDMHAGAQVVVKDAASQIIAAGSLSAGTLPQATNEAGTPVVDRSRSFSECVFTFEVANVPAADFYTVEVSDRGGITYSHAELVEKDWTVDVTLGN